MTAIDDFILRTGSTLVATLLTVLIITERQRRIANAKVDLAAQHIQVIEHDISLPGDYKTVVKDIELAEELLNDVVWSRVASTSKIENVVHITRKLAHVRHKHEKLEVGPDTTTRDAVLAKEIAEKKFTALANDVRTLKVSFVDFVFVHRGPNGQ